MYNNLSTRELDWDILNWYIYIYENQYGRRTKNGNRRSRRDYHIWKIIIKTSGYINFVKRNDPLTTYLIQFLWSQIELNELSPR